MEKINNNLGNGSGKMFFVFLTESHLKTAIINNVNELVTSA